MQLVVESAGVAHRLAGPVPPPERGGGGVAVGALRPLAPLGVLRERNKYNQGGDPGSEDERLDRVSD